MAVSDSILRNNIKSTFYQDLEAEVVILKSTAMYNTSLFAKHPMLIPPAYKATDGSCKIQNLLDDLDKIPPIPLVQEQLAVSDSCEMPCNKLINDLIHMRSFWHDTVLRSLSSFENTFFMDHIIKCHTQSLSQAYKALHLSVYRIGSWANILEDLENVYAFHGCTMHEVILHLKQLKSNCKISSSLQYVISTSTSTNSWQYSTLGENLRAVLMYYVPREFPSDQSFSNVLIENLGPPQFLLVFSDGQKTIEDIKRSWFMNQKKFKINFEDDREKHGKTTFLSENEPENIPDSFFGSVKKRILQCVTGPVKQVKNAYSYAKRKLSAFGWNIFNFLNQSPFFSRFILFIYNVSVCMMFVLLVVFFTYIGTRIFKKISTRYYSFN